MCIVYISLCMYVCMYVCVGISISLHSDDENYSILLIYFLHNFLLCLCTYFTGEY